MGTKLKLGPVRLPSDSFVNIFSYKFKTNENKEVLYKHFLYPKKAKRTFKKTKTNTYFTITLFQIQFHHIQKDKKLYSE